MCINEKYHYVKLKRITLTDRRPIDEWDVIPEMVKSELVVYESAGLTWGEIMKAYPHQYPGWIISNISVDDPKWCVGNELW
jgi:hypothetical protein